MEIIANWMYLVYSLTYNDFKVIVGYSDYLTPIFCGLGAEAGTTGWFDNLKRFSLLRFNPSRSGGRQALTRYSSAPLFNRVLLDELDMAESLGINGIRSNTPYEDDYTAGTVSKEIESLQHWAAINSLSELIVPGDVRESIRMIKSWIFKAEGLYSIMTASIPTSLNFKSDGSHLESLRDGINRFEDMF